MTAIGALAAALYPSEAHAFEFGGGAGTYISFVFGERFGVGWGIEGIFSAVLEGGGSCDSEGRAGLGFVSQIGAINADTFRFVGAVHGGGNVTDELESPVLDGELGVALHAGEGVESVDLGIHTGVVFDVPFSPISAWSNFVRAEWLLDEYSVGGAVVLPGRFGISQQTCIIGRPLRGESSVVHPGHARFVRSTQAPRRRFDGDDELAWAWAEDAQAEAASVPAFLMLAQELLALGAPMHLVDAALDAAEDEIRHAHLCAGIASKLSGDQVVPTLGPAPRRTVLGSKDALVRLAVESWLDGCLNEGAASARAHLASGGSGRADVRGVLHGIARDEARHQKLGWDVLEFAMRAGGEPVREAVAEYRDERVGFTRAMNAPNADAWGQPSRSASEAVNERVVSDARTALERRLPSHRKSSV